MALATYVHLKTFILMNDDDDFIPSNHQLCDSNIIKNVNYGGENVYGGYDDESMEGRSGSLVDKVMFLMTQMNENEKHIIMERMGKIMQ